MKKKLGLKKISVVVVGVLGAIFLIGNSSSAAESINEPEQLQVIDFNFIKEDESIPSDINPVTDGEVGTAEIDWQLAANDGEVLESGSTYTIAPVLQGADQEVFDYPDSDWTILKDINDTEVGQWRLSDKTVEMILGENASGKSMLTGILRTEKNITTFVSSDLLQSIQVGQLVKEIYFQANTVLLNSSIDMAEEIEPADSELQKRVDVATQFANEEDQLKVTDFSFIKSDDTIASEINPVLDRELGKLRVNWQLAAKSGDILKTGEQFTISPVLTTSIQKGFSFSPSNWTPFRDGDGSELGQWRLSNGTVELVLGENANGRTLIKGMFQTEKAISTYAPTSLLQNVQVGQVTKEILFQSVNLIPIPKSLVSKNAQKSTSNTITWYSQLPNRVLYDLGKSQGTQAATINNVYFEDSLDEGVSVSSLKITAPIKIPMSVVSEAYTEMSAKTSTGITITKWFKLVKQNSGESYEEFKNRLEPLNYGIFNSDQQQKIVIFFGDVGNNSLNYKDVLSNKDLGEYVQKLNPTEINDVRKNIINSIYCNNTVFNGGIVSYGVTFETKYTKKLTELKTNNAVSTGEIIGQGSYTENAEASIHLNNPEEEVDPSTEPSTTEPSTTEPSTTEPSTTESSTTEPSTTEPSTTESSVAGSSTTGSNSAADKKNSSMINGPSTNNNKSKYFPNTGEEKTNIFLFGIFILCVSSVYYFRSKDCKE